MPDISPFFAAPPFSWDRSEKAARMLETLRDLRTHHEAACPAYRRLMHVLSNGAVPTAVEDYPFFPVRLFKMFDLRSSGSDQTLKTMTSSATTGQAVSKISIDKQTAVLQTKALVHIVKDFIGSKRLPMVIVDSKSVLKDPKTFSARGAGILGFANFGSDHFYALDDQMQLDVEGLRAFLEKHRGETVLFFGFTYIVWLHFCKAMEETATRLDLCDAIVIHGGGWKKLADQAVGSDAFKERLRGIIGANTRVHNYYGMVEQTGSIYMECEAGHLHASNFSQIIARDPISFAPLAAGERGVIETISVLTLSYPGQALLTEDVGEVLGDDDCPCGRNGRYFMIHGRLPKAEARGCSDTYEMAR